mgnify:CR=1 FL=1
MSSKYQSFGLEDQVAIVTGAAQGYLSLHTRQIDMIMKNKARVDALRAKMRADIDGVLLNATQQ